MSKAEKFISDCTRNCSNEILRNGNESFTNIPRKGEYSHWITPDQARRAVEIAREEMIEKAIKWLQCHYRVIGGGEVEDFIWSLKQAMRDE